MYFLQDLLGVPTNFAYTLYKYGPFSHELRGELGTMQADGFLQVVPQPEPYGPKLQITDVADRQLIERWPKTLTRYDEHLDFVARELGELGVGELERLATALWVRQAEPKASDEHLAERIHVLKPHVSKEQAGDALRRVQNMEQDAVRHGLVA